MIILQIQSGVLCILLLKYVHFWVYRVYLFIYLVCVYRTPFGKEYELTAHTFLDSHKAEQDNNHWLFVTANPTNQNQSLLQPQQDDVMTDELRQEPEPVEDIQVNEHFKGDVKQ